eukprot:2130639-Rhodomonas_salina.2
MRCPGCGAETTQGGMPEHIEKGLGMDREMTLLCVEMKKTAQGVERAHMDAAYAWDGKIKAGLEFVKQVCGESISENLATSFTGQRIEMFQKMAAELAPKAKASSFGVRPDGSKIEALTEQQWVEVYADQRLSDIGFDLPTEELRGGLQSFLAEELRHSPKNALKRVLFECSIEMQCVSQLEVSLRACEEKMRPCTDEFAFLGDEDLYNASVDKLDGVTLRMESLLTYGGRDDDANHDRMMRTLVSIFKSSNVKHSFWGTFEKMAFNRRRPKLWGKMCKVRHGPYRKVLCGEGEGGVRVPASAAVGRASGLPAASAAPERARLAATAARDPGARRGGSGGLWRAAHRERAEDKGPRGRLPGGGALPYGVECPGGAAAGGGPPVLGLQ